MITTSYDSNTHQFPSPIVVRYIQMGPGLNYLIFLLDFSMQTTKRKEIE